MPPAPPAYPPPPWRMTGPAAVVVAPIPLVAARSLVPAPVRVLPVLPGRAVGVVLVADYREGSALRYGEMAGLVGPVVAAGRLGFWVTTMVVDDPASVHGGRELWAVPKELATFAWREGERGSCEVRDGAGGLLVRLAWRARGPAVRLPAAGVFMGGVGGQVRRATLRGSGRLRPVAADLDVPPAGPLAALRLGHPRLALSGHVDVRAGVPRLLPVRV